MTIKIFLRANVGLHKSKILIVDGSLSKISLVELNVFCETSWNKFTSPPKSSGSMLQVHEATIKITIWDRAVKPRVHFQIQDQRHFSRLQQVMKAWNCSLAWPWNSYLHSGLGDDLFTWNSNCHSWQRNSNCQSNSSIEWINNMARD